MATGGGGGNKKQREQRLETINAFLIRTYNPTFNIYPGGISYQNIQNDDKQPSSPNTLGEKNCL